MNTASSGKTRIPGRAWALTGFLLGSAVSVGGNLQAAWLPADHPDTPAGWAPSVASQVGAIVWPLALMVSVEVLSRIAWPDGWGWKLVRVSGLVAVAGGSGVISYGHIYAVLRAWGYGPLGSAVGPLVVDGLMLISGFALVSIGRAARAVPAAAQAVADASPAEPARTPNVPARPVPSGGQEHAVPVTTPTPETVTGTAPTGQPARPARTVLRPAAQAPARPKRPARPASGTTARLSDEDLDLIARLRAARDPETGELPKVPWMRSEFGIGQPRAARLREAAARPDLHTVKAEEVAV